MKHQIVLVSQNENLWEALFQMRKFKKKAWVLVNHNGIKKLRKKSNVMMKGEISSAIFSENKEYSIEFQPLDMGKLGLYYRVLTLISKETTIKFNVSIPEELVLIKYQK